MASFKVEGGLRQHKLRVHDTTYRCDWEGCEFATGLQSALTFHQTSHAKERVLKCGIDGCTLSYANNSRLTAHQLRGHPDAFPHIPWMECSHTGCQYRCKHKKFMTEHVLVHTRPYVCDTCGQTFATDRKLQKHVPSHDPSLKHQCQWPGCQHIFALRKDLNRHQITHVKPDQANYYRCPNPQCNKSFPRADNCHRHTTKHCRKKQ